METKIYNAPEFSLSETENVDVITTSDIEMGVETVPLPEQGGTWEVL